MADGRALTYDAAGQPSILTDPTAGTTTTFGYDDRGNRTSTAVDNGTTVATTTASYDGAGRLVGLAESDGTATSYVYDAAGLRASATTDNGAGSVTEHFTWDTTASVPLLLSDGDHTYVYGAGTVPLAQVSLDDATTTYLHADLTGSVRTATDSTGQVVCDADYDAYGKPVNVTSDECSSITRFGYAGEYTDTTGLVYLRARYYDPAAGQSLSIDPLVDATRNPYGYTAGNPLQFVDPLGLDWLDDTGNWLAGFGDTITFGGTKAIRDLIDYQMGYTDTVDYCSDFYAWGSVGGVVASFVPMGGGLATASAWAATRFPRTATVLVRIGEIVNAPLRALTESVARVVTHVASRVAEAASNMAARIASRVETAIATGGRDAGHWAPFDSGAANTEAVLVDGAGSGTRALNLRPNAADPNWGLTRAHLDKHLIGDGPYSLSRIDPGGNPDVWWGHMQELASRPATATLKGGIEDVIGTFPKTGGDGTFQFGIRVSPASDGSWDLVTLLTKQ